MAVVSSIQGTWYNELGSKVIINAVGPLGVFSGEYHTAVETDDDDIPPTPLVGKTAVTGENDTFGMTVVWQGGSSVTSWTGQLHVCGGEETLMTTWILASKVETCKENWEAYRIGQDYFKRYPIKHDDIHFMRDLARQQKDQK
ncbi:avidin-like [Asterias amurensis]|uniref:avidin-like n=1 Tax=Asterias amurensis TaxID=7602 RepID=UPI003AB385B4